MIKAIVMIVLLACLFCGGMFASLWIMNNGPQEEDAVAAELEEELPPLENPVPIPPVGEIELPGSLRGQQLTADDIFRIGELFRQQHASLAQRKEQIRKDEMRLSLLQSDLDATKQELDGLRGQMIATVQTGEMLLQKVLQEKQQIEASKPEVKPGEAEVEAPISPEAESTNMKQIARWLQGMPPETAAEHMKEMINDGKLKSAAQLISNIDERTAAKILAAVNDPVLVGSLMDEFRKLPRPPKKTKK